jgi:hypothetical protein
LNVRSTRASGKLPNAEQGRSSRKVAASLFFCVYAAIIVLLPGTRKNLNICIKKVRFRSKKPPVRASLNGGNIFPLPGDNPAFCSVLARISRFTKQGRDGFYWLSRPSLKLFNKFRYFSF